MQKTEMCLIIDLPSNSANVTIVDVKDGLYSSIFSKRLSTCVGDGIESLLYEFVLKDACRKVSPDIQDSKRASQKLRSEVHKVKETLSNTNTATVMIESLFDGMDYTLAITRARMEMLTHSVTDNLLSQINLSLTEAGITQSDLSSVIITGGSAYTPAVQETLRSLFSTTMSISNHCDEVVAEGAVIQAQLRHSNKMRKTLPALQRIAMDISCSIGTTVIKLLEEGTVIPVKTDLSLEVEEKEDIVSIDIYIGKEEQQTLLGSIAFDEKLNSRTMKITVSANELKGVVLLVKVMNGEEIVAERMITIGEKE